jgi:hypothetical protein
MFGSGGGTRTRDAAIMSRVLCHLSYTAWQPVRLATTFTWLHLATLLACALAGNTEPPYGLEP